MNSISSLTAEKARLRRRMRALRRRLAENREAASQRAATLARLDLWPPAPFVAAYLAMEVEIDPSPLLRRLAAGGARIMLPAVTARHAPLSFREAGERESLVPDFAGLPAPPPTAATGVPRLVITPLLAFDRSGGRLGQGGGYYDRTLRELRGRAAVFAVGLAFAGQEVERTPMGPCDEPLDAVLTEQGYMEFGKG